VPRGKAVPSRPVVVQILSVFLGLHFTMLATRSFAGVAHRASTRSQVSVHVAGYLCLLIFRRPFGAMRQRLLLLFLLDKKEATYASAYPHMLPTAYF
jgi:hypothetical protein